MSNLLRKPDSTQGKVHDITPESAGWGYVGFGLYRLNAGERAAEATGETEVILVLVEGKAQITAAGQDWGVLGDRMDVFEKTPPHCLYVPNGRELDDPHYHYKLEWLDRLAAIMADTIEHQPDLQLALMGDFNIAPLDTDVWDIDYFAGATHVSEPERQAFEAFEQIGFSDLVRPLVAYGYTYWDYQQLRFPKNEGMRIDFILGTETLAERVVKARIDRDERKGEGPSDHVPVVVELD